MDDPLRDPQGLPALLAGWLPGQRWFAGKDRPIDAVRVVEHTHVPAEGDLQVHHLLVAVDQGSGTTLYQVPVSLHARSDERLEHVRIGDLGGAVCYDALHDKAATAALIAGFQKGTLGSLTFHVEQGAEIPYGQPSIVMGAEQSNTSLVFGDAGILKVFRRISPGPNPDIEVHDALTRAGCEHVAALLGWVDGEWADAETGTASGSLMMLQRYLVTAADGWALASASVRDLFAEADLHADEVGGDFAAESYRLGAATADVHAVMARTMGTATRGRAEHAELAAAMHRRLDAALEVVPQLQAASEQLRRAFDELAELDGPVTVQRIHGDLHLGQVLRTVLGWKLLDFEGEPEKPLAERRQMDSPVRDVAGMLRSFDYAARNLLITDHPGDPQIAYRAEEWATRNRDAFCAGYAESSGRDLTEDAVLLRAYEVDKVVYEAVYEARNRPRWLPIPLAAIERLAAPATDGGTLP